uniref:Uncharacterized protein n=1 Tax=Plectus sambesii TaxID=2011161 RepID=A0A914W020_9BILA
MNVGRDLIQTVHNNLPAAADVTDSVNATSLALPDRIHRSIRIVDDREGLAECVDHLFNSSSADRADGGEVVIGLDTEWRPLFLCSNEQVALIQVATKDCAFLIDVLALESILSEQEWICFFEQLLCTDEAFKLGFDFAGDLRTIAQTLPFCRDVLSGTKNVVCLVQLVKNLCRLDSSFAEDLCASRDGEGSSVDNHNQSTASSSTGDCSLDQSIAESVEDGGGAIVGELPISSQRQKTHSTSQVHFKLTDLCAHLLGRPLDKSEQFGNWAKRPLRPEQIRYAALDAYCQIEIFNELKRKAQELLIDWEDVVARSTVDISAGTKAEHKKSRVRQPKKKMTDAEFRDLIQRLNAATLCDQNGEKTQSPKDVRVAVDSMIQGLGKHLRRCGVDTVIAEDGRSARDTLVKLARTDQRFVLTSGKAYMGLRQRIPNSIVCVPASDENSPLSQLEFVLQHFRVHVREEDIFSRCMVCNCAHFLFVPMPVMKTVYNAVVVTRDLFNPKPFNKTAAITAMNAIDAAVYEGHGAVVKTDGQRVLVECDGGCLDVERGVILDSWTSTEVDGIVLKESVKVKVEALFPNSFVDGRVFFVCFECGKVYWDGSHISNYMSTYGETVLGRESDVTESP